MTDLEWNQLYHDHMLRDFELATDQLLQRSVIAGHVRKRGGTFVYLYVNGGAFL